MSQVMYEQMVGRGMRGKLFGGTEAFVAYVTIAGYHIESGTRTFVDFAKVMIEEFGNAVRPHLRMLYESVRYYPGFNAAGMSSHAEADEAFRTLGDMPTATSPKTVDAPDAKGSVLRLVINRPAWSKSIEKGDRLTAIEWPKGDRSSAGADESRPAETQPEAVAADTPEQAASSHPALGQETIRERYRPSGETAVIGPAVATETAVEGVLLARRAGIRLRVGHEGEILATLPPGMSEAPSWLKEAEAEDEWAFGVAVALVTAVERSGGNPTELLKARTIVIESVQ